MQALWRGVLGRRAFKCRQEVVRQEREAAGLKEQERVEQAEQDRQTLRQREEQRQREEAAVNTDTAPSSSSALRVLRRDSAASVVNDDTSLPPPAKAATGVAAKMEKLRLLREKRRRLEAMLHSKDEGSDATSPNATATATDATAVNTTDTTSTPTSTAPPPQSDAPRPAPMLKRQGAKLNLLSRSTGKLNLLSASSSSAKSRIPQMRASRLPGPKSGQAQLNAADAVFNRNLDRQTRMNTARNSTRFVEIDYSLLEYELLDVSATSDWSHAPCVLYGLHY